MSSPASWVDRIKSAALQNRPSQKPQLWENLPFALRRRVEFEVAHRLNAGWLDDARVITLSQVGFEDGARPLQMEVVPREAMNKALFLYGTLEISETRLVQALLRPGMCFIDVGANIGYYTLIAASIVGPTGAVHAFEPNEVIRTRLSANLRRNELDNVVVHGEAMTSQSGSVRFYASVSSENSGTSSIIPGAGLSAQGEEVPCVSLDDFAATLAPRRIDVLKMDVEGAELDAIKGGHKVLGGADAPALVFEGHDAAPIIEALRAFGYHTRKIDYSLGTGLELRDPNETTTGIFDAYEAPNYFAVKDPARFDEIVKHANARRRSAFNLLGRV
jgi:FkbM family methyltransferase